MRPQMIAGWLAAAASLSSVPAAAQQQQETMADALFRQAREDMKAGRHAKACPKLEESLRLDPTPGTSLNLAICHESIGKLATAAARFREVADSLPATDKRANLALARLTALQPRIPQLRLVLSKSVPTDARVELDGVELRGAALSAWLPVDPGDHVVSIRAGANEQRETVNIGEAQRVERAIVWTQPSTEPVVASAPAPPAPSSPPASQSSPASPPPPPAPPPGRSNHAAFAFLGVGAAGVVTSLVAGGLVLQKKGVVADHCRDHRCDQQGLDAGKAGSNFQTLANVAFVVGAVGLGVGGWLLASPEPHRGASVGYKGTF